MVTVPDRKFICQVDELVAVIGAEPEGDIELGVVPVAAEQLGDRPVAGLSDQVPQRKINA